MVTIVLLGVPQHIFGAEADGQERTLISSGSKWEELAAYSRAVVDGDWIFLSGTVGFNSEDDTIPQDFDQQMDNIFSNISNALAKADAELADIVRVRCFIVDTEYVVPMSTKLRQYLEDIRPANTTVVTQLAAEGALIELEVTALRRKKR
jgi:enamine deaminase RidA (YjgF/YER057c/UK114 family)